MKIRNISIVKGRCGFQAAINESKTRVIAAGSGTYNLYWKNYPSFIEILPKKGVEELKKHLKGCKIYY